MVTQAVGAGVLRDNVYAHMWFNIAASNDGGDLPRGVALLVAPNSPLTDCVTLGNA